MKKFDKIPRIGRANGLLGTGDLWIQEKMDGANFRFTFDDRSEFDSGLIYGSKNVEFHDPENLNKSFRHAVEYVEENADLDYMKQYREWNGDYVVFAEAMHPHTMNYSDDIPDVIAYDLWNSEDEVYQHPTVSEFVLETAGLPVAPYLEREVPVTEWVPEDYEFEDSQWATDDDGPNTEGIIINNPKVGVRAKYRTPEFKEVHSGQSASEDDNSENRDSEMLAAKFTTEARVMKKIHAMRDEGHEIRMSMMDELWVRVYDDVIEEEGDEILTGNYEFNTADFRSSVASRTASVLEAYLARPEDSVLNSDMVEV